MIEAETVVVAAIVVTDPFAVAVDVRCVRVIRAVAVRTLVAVFMTFTFVPVAMVSLGAVVRNVPTANIVVIAMFAMLREGGKGKGQKHC
jgi:hypothetical protein